MDVAETVCVVEPSDGPSPERKHFALLCDHLAGKALFLREMGVELLVCGAVSNGLLRLLNSQGIKVIPFVAGDLETVLLAWLEGRLPDNSLLMPGCGGCGRFGMGSGCPTGSGRRGLGKPACNCVCPACGHREPHVRGIPCVKRQCAVCGAEMVRER